jgi:formylglycine-generating enzyme required for sulfatase activity
MALGLAGGNASRAQTSIAPASIVWIPEGAFVMGADAVDVAFAVQLCQDEHELTLADECGPERFAHETPPARVYLARFGMDRTEVSRADYQRCVAAGACAPARVATDAPADARLPVVGIDAADAAAYCAFAGGRLPTEAEWEKAARGADDRRRFPWGEHYDGGLANHGRPPLRADASDGFVDLAPVGLFAGASPYGLRDMAGNAWEWTASRPRAADVGGPDRLADLRVVRGGSYLHPAVSLRVTARAWLSERSARADLGVRCAYDP